MESVSTPVDKLAKCAEYLVCWQAVCICLRRLLRRLLRCLFLGRVAFPVPKQRQFQKEIRTLPGSA